MASDYYSLLGIPYNATQEEIRNAYFHLARSLHPDVNPDPGARENFLTVQRAYEVLSNASHRAKYDASLPVELRSAPEISVSVKYSQGTLTSLNEPQLTYVLVDLICTAEVKQDRLPPCHICLVLDRSTSMNGPRMDMVKSSAFSLLQQLRPQDILSVVAFSDRAEVLVPPTRAAALSKSDHRISMLQPSGGTEILQGLSLGLNQLRSTETSFIRHLILLTDGNTYGDNQGCIQIAKEAAAEGISINVMGIGHEWNDQLMDKIASLSGGNAVFVTGPRDLEHFLIQKLNDLETTYARSLSFEFESSPDVQLRYAFRIYPSTGPISVSSPMLLGDIHHRKSISFLLEFLLPPLKTELERLTLARGQVWMEIPGRSVPRTRILLDLHRAVRTTPSEDLPPAIIVDAMAKLTLYRMQERVRQEVSEGQVDKAAKHLHYLATHLLSQGDRELAHTVLMEAEHVRQSRSLSGEGEKRIKYGTRALLLPPGPEMKS